MKILITILLTIVIFGIGFIFYMGMLSSYEITEENIGPYRYVYKAHTGPYTETGQIGLEVYNNLLEDGIETTLGLGIYYDNPDITPPDELRSEMGSIVEEKDYEKLAELGDKYNVKNIPETYCMIARFPIKNILSYVMGPMKIYPIMNKYMVEKGYTATEGDVGYEIYDVENKVIIFAMPIKK